ncbi:ImmA/IrrE family metallo-endopeptidase [Desulfolutivibrio sulfoxidireducens]|uniref:ImmA/IrrE family metallo-endopeptidase n=1 Tax=Desulfolutivibrio sulfoxidireducens TaxID=2773299 RepID=UPI00159DA9CC|nr:ImmA/IrrE family metallo-endopeptidase [Desulfolutivibrio sulfoxidireducens]QLA17078.1 ImmA/IrrE family metallo-endopeptidase [Desulfolutivibrio sulfoxidireducens]QLA20646.1 ImmA/IrrE family metallo-endopeptidase [Desulfolutivibrio sulfoxidireducens]
MSVLLDRLYAMAGKRSDLEIHQVPNIDCWGFLLVRDGTFHIHVNEKVRDFRKTMILVEELGEYARRRRAGRNGMAGIQPGLTQEMIVREKMDRAWVIRFSKKLLYMVRRGLHGTRVRRPKENRTGGIRVS